MRVVQGSVDHFVARIDRMNDLCDFFDHSGKPKSAWVFLTGASVPPARKWNHSVKVLEFFVAWLEGKLKAELSSP